MPRHKKHGPEANRAAGKMSLPSVPSLLDATLEELRDGLDAHIFTSCDLVEAYISRIVEVNKQLGAVIELNPDAITIAERCDSERLDRPAPSSSTTTTTTTTTTTSTTSTTSTTNRVKHLAKGPLHGIPLLLNDNIATADCMNTTAGSCILQGARVPEPSTVEARLRDAGAILLGKTNMTEFGGVRGPDCPDGWSGRGGQTFGPFFPRQNPRGSSSGSAVAASLGLAWAAVATDTSADTGSLLLPADAANVVGLRPTLGLVSRHLVIPVSRHLDTVGPVARTVRDAAYLLAAIAGPDPRDEHTSFISYGDGDGIFDDLNQYQGRGKGNVIDNDGSKANSRGQGIDIDNDSGNGIANGSANGSANGLIPDYVAACQLSGLRGKRVGVPRRSIAALMKKMCPDSDISGSHSSPDDSSLYSHSHSLSLSSTSTSPDSHSNSHSYSSPDSSVSSGSISGCPRCCRRGEYALPPDILDKVVDILRGAGAEIVDDDNDFGGLDLPGPLAHLSHNPLNSRDPRNHRDHRYPLEHISFMADLPSRYLSKLSHNPHAIDSLDRLLHFTRAHPHERFPAHDTSSWEAALSHALLLRGGPPALSAEWELRYLDRLAAFTTHGLPALLARHRLDAILCPSPIAAYLAPPAGLPVLSVPLGSLPEGTPVQPAPWPGLVDVAPNRPFGISLVGPKFTEASLLRIGYAIEQGTRARRAVRPLIRPGVDLRDVVAERLDLWTYPDGET